MRFQIFEVSFFCQNYIQKKKQSTEIQLIASLQCRPTGKNTRPTQNVIIFTINRC